MYCSKHPLSDVAPLTVSSAPWSGVDNRCHKKVSSVISDIRNSSPLEKAIYNPQNKQSEAKKLVDEVARNIYHQGICDTF